MGSVDVLLGGKGNYGGLTPSSSTSATTSGGRDRGSFIPGSPSYSPTPPSIPPLGGVSSPTAGGRDSGAFIPGSPTYTGSVNNFPGLGGSTMAPLSYGAGQGPTPGTGQLGTNPFNNSFFFQIPTAAPIGAPADNSGSQPATATGTGGGYGQYLPVIIVGLIIAGLGYYLFERKKK